METLSQIIGTITQILSILGVAFLVYKNFASADQAFDKTIGMNETACDFKHRMVDEKFIALVKAVETNSSDLKKIKDNHLFHIEKDIASINTAIAIILDREERVKTKEKI